MSMRRSALLMASLVVPLALASCGKKKNTEETQPPLTPVPAVAVDAAPGAASQRPMPAAERLTVSGSVEGIDDMLAAFKKLSESYMPDQAQDPKAEIQAGLLGMGFGPGFFNNLDLNGIHLFTTSTAVSGGGPNDSSVAASVAVVDARKLIENMPQSQRPAPLGEGMWELAMDSTRVLMREQGKELLIGMSTADIDAASKLRGQTKPGGARLKMRATNIPTDDIDPSAVLEELSIGGKLGESLAEVVRELEAFTFELDFGTSRDFFNQTGAEAPFHKLGLQPIGKPRAAATALESRLPPDPMFVTTFSWGDPALLHKMVDSVPMGQVPDPVKPMVEKAVKSAHGLLDQVASDVTLALYLDKKGKATFVMAADVKDDVKTKAALQGVHQVLNEGVQTQATLEGKNKDGAFSAKLELDGLKMPGASADHLTIKIPKDYLGDAKKAKMFLSKGSIEAISYVHEGTAILAIGAGARGVVTDVAKNLGKPRKKSLAQHAGLQGVRTAMGGCQICIAGDPLEYFRFRLLLVRDGSEDKAVTKQAGAKLGELSKLASIGQTGAGASVQSDRASLGLLIPQATVFAPAATVEALGEINDFVDDPESAMAEAADEKADSKPGKGGKPGKKSEPKKSPAKKAG